MKEMLHASVVFINQSLTKTCSVRYVCIVHVFFLHRTTKYKVAYLKEMYILIPVILLYE